MVSLKGVQRYDRDFIAMCIMGFYGGRWKTYRQLRSSNSGRDLIWFVLLLIQFSASIFWLYFWFVLGNDAFNLNWLLYQSFHRWYDWYTIFYTMIIVGGMYTTLITLLGVGHAACGRHLRMHRLHRLMLSVQFLTSITSFIGVLVKWPILISLLQLSLYAMGVYLYIAAVVVMTLMTWLIARGFVRIRGRVQRLLPQVLYGWTMLTIYASPLFLASSPCIMRGSLPPRPRLVAHRGTCGIAPENTLLAFENAAHLEDVVALEGDVTLSADGVPFMMHDDTLLRTTDVAEKFPDRANDHAHMFTIAELRSLNAGHWFLKNNPHGTVSSLTVEEKELIAQQKIPTLKEVAQVVKRSNKSFMFDLQLLLHAKPTFPFFHNATYIVLHTLWQSGIDPKKILWFYTKNVTSPEKVTIIYPKTAPEPSWLQAANVSGINVRYDRMPIKHLGEYTARNVSTNAWVVNSAWMYSLFWCAGVTSVTTNHVDSLVTGPSPTWVFIQDPNNYMLMCLSINITSIAIICMIFFYHNKSSAKRGSIPAGLERIPTGGDDEIEWGSATSSTAYLRARDKRTFRSNISTEEGQGLLSSDEAEWTDV